MMKYLSKIFLIGITVLGLSSCASSGLYIDNNVPKSKIVLEENPDQNTFYADTYESVSQRIYDTNVKVINLQDGENDFPLNKDSKEYAVYFILPITDNNKLQNWKFLIDPTDSNEFTIDNGNVTKD
ncbi:type VI secretion system lipoprotein IglE [Pseudofrancisella aestuarii]|uniref:Type VI secretion system lipoprotein IglE n=1 Tax=Pseudofrancisella aestuarii TaxID=2670347 RepID=A0ABV9TAS2_9GAMM|nr:type VI secretion system lipoprotein IglE [Pseudofrancisella aestuarii]